MAPSGEEAQTSILFSLSHSPSQPSSSASLLSSVGNKPPDSSPGWVLVPKVPVGGGNWYDALPSYLAVQGNDLRFNEVSIAPVVVGPPDAVGGAGDLIQQSIARTIPTPHFSGNPEDWAGFANEFREFLVVMSLGEAPNNEQVVYILSQALLEDIRKEVKFEEMKRMVKLPTWKLSSIFQHFLTEIGMHFWNEN